MALTGSNSRGPGAADACHERTASATPLSRIRTAFTVGPRNRSTSAAEATSAPMKSLSGPRIAPSPKMFFSLRSLAAAGAKPTRSFSRPSSAFNFALSAVYSSSARSSSDRAALSRSRAWCCASLALSAAAVVSAPREAAIRQGWDEIIGSQGAFVGMTTFGASAPAKELYKHFGITAEKVAEAALSKLQSK